MIIYQDSREQLPLDFNDSLITEVRTVTLGVGDYGCQFKDGSCPPVFFERKSIGDLFATLGSNRDRFKRMLMRARDNGVGIILIVEGTTSDVLRGWKYSRIRGLTIVRQVMSLWVRGYIVAPVFCKDRKEMATVITEYYAAVGRKAIADRKETKH